MNYLGRPIFIWAIDWSAAIARNISYDLRETSLGFGAEFYFPTETFTAQSWDFSSTLYGAAAITAVDEFTASLSGRLNGFWLPVPFEAFQIVAAIGANSFKIKFCNLTATWQDRPDIQLSFQVGDINPLGTMTAAQFAAITNVVNNHDGTETVTIGANLNPAPAPGMFVKRLHYVRLTEDVESANFAAEGWQERPFKVIELPLEYANVETGRSPIYLYEFDLPAPMIKTWRYTSFAAPVWSLGNLYQPFPMTHGGVKETSRGDTGEIDITAKPDASHPFSLFFPAPLGQTMTVTVTAVSLGLPDEGTEIFTGIVRAVDDDGTRYTAHCASLLYLLDRKAPWMLIQPQCNYALFDPPTCGIQRAAYTAPVLIDATTPALPSNTVVVSMIFPTVHPERPSTANWFAGGIFETGYGVNYEPRTITSSSWNPVLKLLTLTLNIPLYQGAPGDWCYITAGCDGAASTCTTKFNNFNRFGGFIAVPSRNPSLEALNAPVSQGGKK
jgi:hypothetical protein